MKTRKQIAIAAFTAVFGIVVGFTAAAQQAGNGEKPAAITSPTGIKMVWVQSGSFAMGDTIRREIHRDTRPYRNADQWLLHGHISGNAGAVPYSYRKRPQFL
jgi:hypothetical protein